MGESLVVASNDEDKMVSSPALEVSVSFGRFENDSLSWEKWSSFSPNKYLEEVEKCATPGSVAQKKAYFEAHYKKIAAKKAELLDQQEKVIEHVAPVRAGVQIVRDLINVACVQDSVLDASDSQTSTEGDAQMKDPNSETEVDSAHFGESNEDVVILIEGCEISVDNRLELDGPTVEEPEDAALVEEEEGSAMETQETQGVKELPKNMEEEVKVDIVSIIESKTDNLDVNGKETQRMIPMNKVTEKARVKTKPLPAQMNAAHISTPKLTKPVSASRGIRAHQFSTTKVSKPAPTPGGPSSVTKTHQFSTPNSSKLVPARAPGQLSASQSSTKKVVSSSIPWSKNHSAGENKKVTPKSLHMSLNKESPKTDPVPYTTTRTSFIMEKMKDKDIVRRAFKTFEKNFDQLKSSAVERSLGSNQAHVKGNETKGSPSPILQKQNGGSIKAGGLDKRTAKAAPSVSLKSEDKRRESPMKSAETFQARTAGTTLHGPKSKEEKESEIKKLRQRPNVKSTHISALYHGRKVPKSLLDKEGSKSLGI